ncbi:MAG: xanthine dehydrogenase family protein subunit M [Caulobacter sp.]
MKAAPFDYVAPDTIEEALEHLSDKAGDCSVLAGGQTLVPLLALRMATPSVLIDINRIAALSGVGRADGSTRIGATTRQNEALAAGEVGRHVPALAKALRFVGHHQTRNRGTIGGSIALGEPAAECPATVLALGAVVEARSTRGVREIPAENFYLGPYTTALEMDEMITAVRFPDWPAGAITVVHEVARRPGDFAMVGLVCAFAAEDGQVSRAGIGWFGMGPQPMRSRAAEAAMVGRRLSAADMREIAQLAVSETDPLDDAQADGAYRRTVGARIFERVVGEALSTGRAT